MNDAFGQLLDILWGGIPNQPAPPPSDGGDFILSPLNNAQDFLFGGSGADMIQQTVTMSPFMLGLTVFVLAIFVGYYVVWNVTPALHSPLMAVTNAVSSVIIIGALIACGLPTEGIPKILGFLAVMLASINIFGGFVITQRMLQMFMKKK